MAGLFSNGYNRSYGHSGALYIVASDLCEMGLSFIDVRDRSFALRPVSNQNDLDLLSSERKGAWHLKFT